MSQIILNRTLSDNTANVASVNQKLPMDILIRQARRSLDDFLKPDFLEARNVPLRVFDNAKGLLFVTILSDGVGAGIMLKRLENNNNNNNNNDNSNRFWSDPCAVLIEDAKLGLSLNHDRTKHILVFSDDRYFNDLFTNEEIILKDDNSITTLSIGRDVDFSISTHATGYEEVQTVSVVKGTNMEDTLEGLRIRIDHKWNEQFYKQPLNIQQILNGDVQVSNNQEYNLLCNLLQQIRLINNHENSKQLTDNSITGVVGDTNPMNTDLSSTKSTAGSSTTQNLPSEDINMNRSGMETNETSNIPEKHHDNTMNKNNQSANIQ